MNKKGILLAIALVWACQVGAQPTDHAWLETSQLKVRINADGRLFCDDEKGAFLVPQGDSMVSLMRGAGLWFGGLDIGNNLTIAAQTPDPQKTDIVAGFRGIPNSGRVWKVTRAEIDAHRRDFLDNLTIDDPIPSIFAWPGRRNPFFSQYHDFRLPDSMARFYISNDWNPNGRYEPHRGEIPTLPDVSFDFGWQVPTEMVCFAFHTDGPRLLSNASRPYPVQVWGWAFVYDCPENELLSRSVFVHYRWLNVGKERRDSAQTSVFIDVDLGNKNDDYHGFLPKSDTYFVYNSTETDSLWQQDTPLFFASMLNRPYQFEHDEQLPAAPLPVGLMPYGGGIPPGTHKPVAINEFYNYMTGTWRDGTPLRAIGTGYAPGWPPLPSTQTAFPGYPDTPDAWTEANAQNPAGDRAALMNARVFNDRPGTINSLTMQYAYAPKTQGSHSERIKSWKLAHHALRQQLGCCEFNGDWDKPAPLGCEYYAPGLPVAEPWTVSPNPANEFVRVWHQGIYLRKMLLFDALGRVMAVGEYRDQYSELSVRHLPSGMYFLYIEDEDGTKKTEKIVVAHGAE